MLRKNKAKKSSAREGKGGGKKDVFSAPSHNKECGHPSELRRIPLRQQATKTQRAIKRAASLCLSCRVVAGLRPGLVSRSSARSPTYTTPKNQQTKRTSPPHPPRWGDLARPRHLLGSCCRRCLLEELNTPLLFGRASSSTDGSDWTAPYFVTTTFCPRRRQATPRVAGDDRAADQAGAATARDNLSSRRRTLSTLFFFRSSATSALSRLLLRPPSHRA